MEVSNLPLHLEYVMYSGNSIPREEQMILSWSLNELKENNNFEKTYFWGIIYGEKNDYYIAYGVRKDRLRGRIYFYSLNCDEWLLVTKPNEEFEKKVLIAHKMFVGDPSFQLEVIDEEPQELVVEDEEPTHDTDDAMNDILKAPPPSTVKSKSLNEDEADEKEESPVDMVNMLKEEDRLSLTIKLITEECAVAPRGAYVKHMSGRIQEDENFKGLEPEEALEFRSYFHLRPPRLSFNKNLSQRADSDFAIDIMDTIDDDIPNRKTWTIRNNDDDMVIIKNLTWPGMMFYHKVNTDIYGFVYIGFGYRNLDLPFMI